MSYPNKNTQTPLVVSGENRGLELLPGYDTVGVHCPPYINMVERFPLHLI